MANQGVNLGGWFIPEKWMTPELFVDLDASDAIGLLRSDEGRRRYEKHIQTFVSERDLNKLTDHKISFLRVPVAWWMIADRYSGLSTICLARLDAIFDYAERHSMKILIDFHAAQGSQNGKDHSGRVGRVAWHKYSRENKWYIEQFAARYSDSPSLWGVELLNEPLIRGQFWHIYWFNRSMKAKLRSRMPESVRIVIHDGFIPLLFSNISWRKARTVLDLHLYEIPTRQGDSVESYMNRRDRLFMNRIRLLGKFQPVIIGEWSGVLPEELLRSLTDDERRRAIRENIARQKRLYDVADAWMFWSLKSDDQMMWNFLSSL